jgi:hypothetical protein
VPPLAPWGLIALNILVFLIEPGEVGEATAS